MTVAVLAAAAVVLAVLALWAAGAALRARSDLRVHQATYRHTAEDLDAARADSVSRSRVTVNGKVQEHLALYLPELADRWNPRDARFLGSPIDFVIFDGLDEGGEVSVTFVEIKTGKSGLTGRERKVRDAVREGRVGWEMVRLGSGQELPAADSHGIVPATPEPPAPLNMASTSPATSENEEIL